ncbi:hypothetical protein GDO86_007252 [Hymenochirus boettgeri]|uniref:Uncharacterized protein n=1 Tax=Hymenochirus boettgeri TaxID=247094 RepID=A0A8T2J125_9PIPI|nr:hypothetical protein GDO86_007252 [Hymenochirus boettgeri]
MCRVYKGLQDLSSMKMFSNCNYIIAICGFLGTYPAVGLLPARNLPAYRIQTYHLGYFPVCTVPSPSLASCTTADETEDLAGSPYWDRIPYSCT